MADRPQRLREVEPYWEQSFLSVQFRSFSLQMDEESLTRLLHGLGERGAAYSFEQKQIDQSSGRIALRWQSFGSRCPQEDLAALDADPTLWDELSGAILTAVDADSGRPLLCRVDRERDGGAICAIDLVSNHRFSGRDVLVDRELFSQELDELLAERGNRCAVREAGDGAAGTAFGEFLSRYGALPDFLDQEDFFTGLGVDFLLLICGLVERRLRKAIRALGRPELTAANVLLRARGMCMNREGEQWRLKNALREDLALFSELSFTPLQSWRPGELPADS